MVFIPVFAVALLAIKKRGFSRAESRRKAIIVNDVSQKIASFVGAGVDGDRSVRISKLCNAAHIINVWTF